MFTRFWEMSSGSLLFLVLSKNISNIKFLKNIYPLPILILILGTFLLPLSAAIPATILIIIFTFSCVLIIFLQTRYNRFALSKFLLVSFLFIDILIPYFMKDNYGNLDYILEDCSKNIVSEDCFDSYNSFKGYFSK